MLFGPLPLFQVRYRTSMKLYVMRHGPAEDVAQSGRDIDRALTAQGRSRVQAVAEELVKRAEAPRLIVSSPLVRALQTAEIVASICLPELPVTVRREIAPGGDLAGLAREYLLAGARRVMFVGHEPDVSGVVASMTRTISSGMEKGMVVGLRLLDGEPSVQRFVVDPKANTWV